MQDLKLVFDGRIRHWRLLRDIVERIDTFNRFSKPGSGVSPDGIHFALYQKIVNQPSVSQPHSHVPSIDEVRDAMALLASRGIGILREAPAGSGIYCLTIHLDGATKRIGALAHEIEQVDLTATSIAATGSLKKI